MNRNIKFNSKLLLFGEYGLMFNADALSIPFPKFSAYLDYDSDEQNQISSAEIKRFFNYLTTKNIIKELNAQFDTDLFEADLNKNMFLNSNIPYQYGLGSSGALIAALYSRYTKKKPDSEIAEIDLIKNDLALLENFFHGRSSGIDPLVSLINLPIHVNSNKKITTPEFNLHKSEIDVFLIDTEVTGATGPLVNYFIEQMANKTYYNNFVSGYLSNNNNCIDNLLANNLDAFFSSLEKLVLYEMEHFKKMIPERFLNIIKNSLNKGIYIKLLGSGGGGYLLAFSNSEYETNNWLIENKLTCVKTV